MRWRNLEVWRETLRGRKASVDICQFLGANSSIETSTGSIHLQARFYSFLAGLIPMLLDEILVLFGYSQPVFLMSLLFPCF